MAHAWPLIISVIVAMDNLPCTAARGRRSAVVAACMARFATTAFRHPLATCSHADALSCRQCPRLCASVASQHWCLFSSSACWFGLMRASSASMSRRMSSLECAGGSRAEEGC